MSEKATIKISRAAAPYLGADKPREERLKAAAGKVELPPGDFVLLIYYLCHDPDGEVKQTALTTLRGLDVPFILEVLQNRQLHPRVLDALVQLHGKKWELLPFFSAHPMLSDNASRYLASLRPVPKTVAASEAATPATAEGQSTEAGAAPGAPPDDDAPVDESADEFLSKYQLSQSMGVAEKIKMALTGDKEWRTILIKDSNKLVSGAVVKNPRITENEILTISKSAVQNDEVMRVICANKEWIKNPAIRKALVMNHKTPLPAALRFVSTLSEKELAMLAKSKNVSSVIVSQARRILLSKKDR